MGPNLNSVFFSFTYRIYLSPLRRGCDRVSSRAQQSPVVSITSCGDVVDNPLHTNGCIGNSCTIPNISDPSLYANMNLQPHIPK